MITQMELALFAKGNDGESSLVWFAFLFGSWPIAQPCPKRVVILRVLEFSFSYLGSAPKIMYNPCKRE